MEQRTEKVPHGAGDQTIGRRRQQQDDYWLGRTVGRVKSEQGLVGILADGMGGHSGGRQAALAAVCGFRAAFYSHTEGDQQLDVGVEEANQMVREFQEAEGHEPGATGTTLIGVRITKDTIQWDKHRGLTPAAGRQSGYQTTERRPLDETGDPETPEGESRGGARAEPARATVRSGRGTDRNDRSGTTPRTERGGNSDSGE